MPSTLRLLSLVWLVIAVLAGVGLVASAILGAGSTVSWILLGVLIGSAAGVITLAIAVTVRVRRSPGDAAARPGAPRRHSARGPFLVSAAVVVVVGTTLATTLFAVDAAKQAELNAPTAAELLVTDYLDAIADGDAAAAVAIDGGGELSAHLDSTDRDSFLVDRALGAATERISEVRASESRNLTTPTATTVRAFYTLAGEEYRRELELRRDDEESDWRLVDSLAVRVEMWSSVQGGNAPFERVAFSLGGVSAAASEWAARAVYPAVYPLRVDIEESALADPDATPVLRDYAVAQSDTRLVHEEFVLAAP